MQGVKIFLGVVLGSILFMASGCSDPLGISDGNDSIDWRNGESIPPVESPELSEKEKQKYRTDAEKLAVRRVNQLDSSQTDIPEKLVDHLYNGLVRIATSEHPKAKEVIEEYPVHALIPAHPREVLVRVNRSASWIEAWREGTTETGQPHIDSLIHRFDFTLAEFREPENASGATMGTLQSDRPVNGMAVGERFEQHEDVLYAGPDGVIGPTDIIVGYFDNYLQYTFKYGWGDCPSGCIHEHVWHFTVNVDGTVEFVGEEGDPLPDN